jgi:zinc transport system permease protein
MFDDFFVRAVLGAVGIALVAGPLGCHVAWRRMAYFGDSLAHSALLGVALGIAFGVDLNIGILVVCVAVALLLVLLQRQRWLAMDTMIGIMAHGALSLGLVAVSLIKGARLDLLGLMFGDVLSITTRDLAWIYGGGAVVAATTLFYWRPLLALTVHEDLARAEGVRVDQARLALMILIALVVAIAMKIVGILLIAALLIIPAATARRLARTPEQMALLASGLGVLAVLGGLHGSLAWDTPAGPSIVVASLALFLLALLAGATVQLIALRRRRAKAVNGGRGAVRALNPGAHDHHDHQHHDLTAPTMIGAVPAPLGDAHDGRP